ncbi:phage tail assembly protein [Streptomyces sp. NPDC059080]|uniref:phage tail assembly protein n=1 Tax=Streptomyces sp. NPDC059080 TaxID=3346718 RepID=UPI0036895344
MTVTVLSCADLMEEAQRDYAALPIQTQAGNHVQLRNLLMLSREGLKTARVLLEKFEKNTGALEELEPHLRDLILVIADDPKAMADEMQAWPLGMYVRVVTLWQEATQAPEAQDSDS